jgi:aryl-alcohol dehydrogenase-like predicted oxidoreductase
MEMKDLGSTGLKVSRLGMGLYQIGEALTPADEAEVAQLLNAALDSGINFLDTSACYGISEELIGRAIAYRRQEYILATKCGHVTGGYQGEEWTAQTIKDSIQRSLVRLKTDYLDLVQLHSCEVDVLERGEAVRALLDAKAAGKTRYAGYSGDNDAARWAVESGLFDTLQTSFNLVDQHARTHLFPLAQARHMGIIVKRPIANGMWGASKSCITYTDDYFERAKIMAQDGPIPGAPENRILLALGFTLAHQEVDTAIVGTCNHNHLCANIAWVENGFSFAPEVVEELHRRFACAGQRWIQLT